MASSLNIQEVQLNNTFDEFRLRTNTVIAELNKFGTGSATVTVGSLETSTGLGEDGHLTVNGDLLVTGNATIEGNLTFGNAETDTISFVADIASNVLPDTPYNFSLGSATKQWQDLYLSGTAAINIVTAQSATVVNDFTVDTNTFHVDSTTNRIGILDTSPEVTLDIGSATDAIHIPVGTTAERPGSPESGFFRYNTSLSQFEGYTTTWGAIGGGGTNTFTTDIFTGDNSTTDFVLSQATEFDTSLMVFIDGVYQTPNAYDISTTLGITTLSFSAAPANGRTIVAYVVAAGVSGNNLNQNLFTGDGATVTYTLSIAPVNKNNTQVFIDGVYQQKDAYSVSGYDVTFTDPPPDQTTIEVMTFTQTEVNVPVDGTIKSIHLSGDLVTPGALDVTTDLTVTGTTTLNGNLVIGDANTDTITISSEISSSLIPSQDITYDLGASGNAWRDLYLAGSTIYIGGGKLEYNDTSNQFELKNAADAVVPVSLSANSTTDLSEGTRLYYTTGRVLSDGTSIVPGGSLTGTVGDAALQYRADGNYSGTPQQGSFYFDGLNSRLKVYTGASFIDAVPVSGGGGGATTDANATFSKYLYTIASQTNVVTGASDEVVGYTQLYIGKDYEIVSEGSTDFIAFGATTGTVGETFTVDSDGTSNIADLVLAKEYEIVTAGDTDFTVIGAVDNNVGTVFTFNGVTSQSATTGTVIAEGNGTANPVLVYVVDDATSVEVYVNGIKQYEGATNDYVATTGSSVNFTYNLPVDALVDVQVYELLTNDAYYIKTETYSQAQVNTQISNALTIYDDQTASDARYVNIGGDTMTGNLSFGANVKAVFGAGSDLQIYSDGTTGQVTGNVNVTGSVTATGILEASDGTNGEMQFGLGTALTTGAGTYDSSVRWNGSAGNLLFSQGAVEKMRISTTGIDVTGSVTADGLTVDGNASTTGVLTLGNAGIANAFINSADSLYINIDSNNDQAGGNDFQIGRNSTGASSEKIFLAGENGDISFYEDTGTTPKLAWSAANERLTLTGSDYQFGIQQGANQPWYTRAVSDGTFRLHINGTGDIITASATGIDVTGTVTADGLTVVAADAALAASIGSNGQRVYITPNGTEISYNASGNSAGSHMFQTGNIDRLNIASNGDISFYNTAGNSQALFWDASAESLGIGTTSPAANITIDKGLGAASPTTFTTANSYLQLGVSDYNSSGGVYAIGFGYSGGATHSPAYIGLQQTETGSYTKGDLVFRTRSTSTDVEPPERMRIGSDGQLTSSVAGAVFKTRADGGGLEYTQLLDVATAGCTIFGKTNRGDVASISLYQTATGADGGYIKFSTSNSGSTTPTEKVRITQEGNLLVGTTTTPSLTGLAVGSTTTGKNISVFSSANGTNGVIGIYQSNGTQEGQLYAGTGDVNLFGTSAVKVVAATNGVELTSGATSWTAISDERKKDIIEPITNAAQKVSTLRSVIGKYKTDSEGTRRSFLIAQDVQAVLPEAVDASDENELGLRYTETIPLLVAAIQEQQEQIEQLKADIAVLKGAN